MPYFSFQSLTTNNWTTDFFFLLTLITLGLETSRATYEWRRSPAEITTARASEWWYLDLPLLLVWFAVTMYEPSRCGRESDTTWANSQTIPRPCNYTLTNLLPNDWLFKLPWAGHPPFGSNHEYHINSRYKKPLVDYESFFASLSIIPRWGFMKLKTTNLNR